MDGHWEILGVLVHCPGAPDTIEWLKANVWASSAKYGCETTAFRLNSGPHRYSTEAVWPSEDARQAWVSSDDFKTIPPFPGTDSPWGAQVDMEAVEYRPVS